MTTKVPAELSSTPGIVDNSNATAMTIDSSESVLISKTSSSITNTGTTFESGGRFFTSTDGEEAAILNRQTSDGEILEFRKDNTTTVGTIGTLSSLLGIGNGDAGLLMAGSVDAVAPYNASTNATRDAAIDLGTSTNRFQSIFLSGGAYLGGTGSANYLDDYETGTFTPTVVSGITSVSYSSQVGYYTKVGETIMISMRVQLSSGTQQSSLLSFAGLPEAARASTYGAGFVSYTSSFANQNVNFYVNPGSTQVSVYKQIGTNFAGNDLVNVAFDLRLMLAYLT